MGYTVVGRIANPSYHRWAMRGRTALGQVWDAQTGQELHTCKGHTDQVASVAFSPDGKRLASASADKRVKVWDAQTGPELLTLQGHTRAVRSVAFSPDGKRLASGGSGGWEQGKPVPAEVKLAIES